MHDDNITQEEFEKAAAMNFPQITIPDPAAVEAMLDEAFPHAMLRHAAFDKDGWRMFAMMHGTRDDPIGKGATPEDALVDLKTKLAENDPLEKLRKEWVAAGKPNLEAP